MMTTSINYTLDVGLHSDSMYKSYEEITDRLLGTFEDPCGFDTSNYTLDVSFHSDSMYKSYGEITAACSELVKTLVVLIRGGFEFRQSSRNSFLSFFAKALLYTSMFIAI